MLSYLLHQHGKIDAACNPVLDLHTWQCMMFFSASKQARSHAEQRHVDTAVVCGRHGQIPIYGVVFPVLCGMRHRTCHEENAGRVFARVDCITRGVTATGTSVTEIPLVHRQLPGPFYVELAKPQDLLRLRQLLLHVLCHFDVFCIKLVLYARLRRFHARKGSDFCAIL